RWACRRITFSIERVISHMSAESQQEGYTWRRIEDLPSNWAEMSNRELESLPHQWDSQRLKLANSSALEDFNLRLHREWAIETGIIEDLYTIDRGTTETLIEHGIVSSLIAHGSSDI